MCFRSTGNRLIAPTGECRDDLLQRPCSKFPRLSGNRSTAPTGARSDTRQRQPQSTFPRPMGKAVLFRTLEEIESAQLRNGTLHCDFRAVLPSGVSPAPGYRHEKQVLLVVHKFCPSMTRCRCLLREICPWGSLSAVEICCVLGQNTGYGGDIKGGHIQAAPGSASTTTTAIRHNLDLALNKEVRQCTGKKCRSTTSSVPPIHPRTIQQQH